MIGSPASPPQPPPRIRGRSKEPSRLGLIDHSGTAGGGRAGYMFRVPQDLLLVGTSRSAPRRALRAQRPDWELLPMPARPRPAPLDDRRARRAQRKGASGL